MTDSYKILVQRDTVQPFLLAASADCGVKTGSQNGNQWRVQMNSQLL